jgi:serine/threonine-protein kinase
MAVVYLAWDPNLERKVALKILTEALSEDESFQQRFQRESRVAAGLGHPNVVPVFSAGESDGVLYIAMQYVEGTDLKVLIQKEGRLDPARAVSICSQVGRALDAAHRKELTHRDVKPANILIVPRPDEESEDQAYLSDFGLTKRGGSEPGLTITGQFLGTLDYVAPEQIQGREIDGRADVYALGCVLYQCLTGSPPFQKDNEAALIYAHLMDPPPMVRDLRPELPPAIDTVIAKAMSKSKEDRYQTASAMCAAARAALASEIPTTPAHKAVIAETKVVEQPKSAPAAKPPPVETSAKPPADKPPAAAPPAKPPAARPGPPADFPRPAERAPREGDRRGGAITGPRVIVALVALVAIIAVGAGAYVLWPRPPTGTNQPQAGARGLVPSDDNNGAARVADFLFPPIPTQGAEGNPCGSRSTDGYNGCPLTERLAARVKAKPLGSSEPLCRCSGPYTQLNRSISSTDNGATVHFSVLDQSARSHAIDITVIKTNDGWVASDTTCTDKGGSSIFNDNPPDCT